MVADIGTKALTAARMEFLKNLLGMKGGLHRGLQELKDKIESEKPSDPTLMDCSNSCSSVSDSCLLGFG